MAPGNDAGGRTRTALVTRGTGGRGRVIAAKLAADGFDVAVANVGSIDLADATVNEIKEQGGTGRHSRRTSPTRKRVVAGTRVREPIAQRRRRAAKT